MQLHPKLLLPITFISKIDKNQFIPTLHCLSRFYHHQYHLKSIKKYITNNGYISTRVKSLEYTLAKIIPICKDIGVTRISDITYMDKLYIPNFSAILPNTEDSIWVYSGKGIT